MAARASSRPGASRRQNGGKAAASTARMPGPVAVVAAAQLGGPGAPGGEVVEVADEQVQPLVHLEAGVEERALLGGRRGRR